MTLQNNQTQTTTQTTTATAWDLDPTHSAVEFSVKHMMFATVRGRFGAFAADVRFDDEDPTRSYVNAEIDVASIDTGVGDRDGHLRSGDFFDAETHPKIVFQSRKVEPKGQDQAKVTGDLTIRGITREIVLDVRRDGIGQDPWGNTRAAYSAEGTIDREAFGLKWNQLLETGGVLVGNQVRLHIQAQFVARKRA